MKKHLLAIVTLFMCTLGMSQISYTNPGNGQYHYSSQLQHSNLHFYLFGDGHHSYEMSPSHNFDASSNPSAVVVYTSDPYENDPPELLNINVVNNGMGSATPQGYNYTKKVQLIESWNLVNSRENYYILMFQNNESPNQNLSGCVEFHYKLDDSYVESSSIKDDYINNNWVSSKQHVSSDYPDKFTHKFTWEYSDLAYGEKRFIYIPADCIAPALAFVNARAVMKVDDCSRTFSGESTVDGSATGVNNSPMYTLTLRVVNTPHDPNGIVTDPGCLLFPPDKELTIRYKIYFQNDGLDPVENVMIKFTNDVPITNMQIVDASDPCTLSWTPQDIYSQYEPIIIRFDGILLPGLQDSLVEYESTYGWIEFDVCYSEENFDQLQTDCSNTEAHIIFDELAPVIAYNEICRPSSPNGFTPNNLVVANLCNRSIYTCPIDIKYEQDFAIHSRAASINYIENNQLQNLNIFPNPANNTLHLANIDLRSLVSFKITNTKGQTFQSTSATIMKENQDIDISNLENGLYFISVMTEETMKTIPFVKL